MARLYELSKALGTPLEELLKSNDGRRQVIALIGLRGAGKTTIGKRLAKTLKRSFLELDQMIEEEAGLRLDEVFELHGEAYYRRLEREVLRRFLSTGTAAVIASGGGLVTDRITYDILKQRTLTVWLKARPEDYLARVAAQGDRRPMAGRAEPLAELRELLKERETLYAEAEVTVETSEKTPEEITRNLLQKTSVDQ